MDDGLPSSSSSYPPLNRDQILTDEAAAVAVAAAASEEDNDEQRKARLQRDKRAAFLDHLIRNVDIMTYCQLSILYYMDISLMKFLIRAIPHWFYFTPKPVTFPLPPRTARPYIGVIFTTNLICTLLHSLFSPPAGGEATRGYLHGGMLMDFVGQESPVSKIRLLSLDLLTLGLQLIILAVILERRNLDPEPSTPNTSPTQDHDSEERGIFRSPPSPSAIELQPLTRGRTGADEDRERNELSPDRPSTFDEHPLDPFHSGQHIIAHVDLPNMIRTQWIQRRNIATAARDAGGLGRASGEGRRPRMIRFRIRREVGS